MHYQSIQKIFSQHVSKGIYIFFSNILEKFTFFILFVILARRFSGKTYGHVTACFAFANLLMTFFEFGFSTYFQRETASGNKELKNEFNQAFTTRVLLFVPFYIMAMLYFKYSSIYYSRASMLLSSAVFVYSICGLFNAVLFGKEAYKQSFLLLLFSRLSMVVGIISVIEIGKGFTTVAGIFVLSGLIHLISLFWYVNKYDFRPHFTMLSWSMLRRMLAASLPLGLSIVFVWTYDRVDILLLRYFKGDIIIALYAVAYSLYKAPQAFSNFIFTPLFSDLSKEFAGRGKINKSHIYHKIWVLTASLLPFIAVGFLMAEFITSTIYGSFYAQAAPYFKVLLFALPGLLLNNFTGIILNSARKEQITTQCVFAVALANIIFNIIAIPKIGVWGAVYSTIFTEYLTFLLQLYFIKKYRILD
ncbi:MAG: oligosaccharide flippase family protein [Ignavibacteria bacterium]|nr:oligosaccharide flippase family protein [Ignavibacteria bacterium]